MRLSQLAVGAIALTFFGTPAGLADSYPSKPIRLIVPVAAGASNDLVARFLGDSLTALTGQPVVIDNRPGAGGMLGLAAAAKANPDGYTLVLAAGGQVTVNHLLQKEPPINPLTALVPVAPVADVTLLLTVNSEVPAKTLSELIALAQSRPGKISYGSPGPGSTSHLAMASFANLANVDIVHVPYRGAALAINDLVGGFTQMMAIGINSVAANVKDGRIRVLATGSAERLPYLKDVPTAAEAGVPGWQFETWFGLFAPRGTPQDVVDKLNGYVRKAVNEPAMLKRMEANYMHPWRMTTDEFAAFLKTDAERFARLVKDIGLKPK